MQFDLGIGWCEWMWVSVSRCWCGVDCVYECEQMWVSGGESFSKILRLNLFVVFLGFCPSYHLLILNLASANLAI